MEQRFIVIEMFDPEWPSIVTNEDGKPIIFESQTEARIACDDCQEGIVIPLSNGEACEEKTASPVMHVCSFCGSKNVVADAYLFFNPEKQDYEPDSIFDDHRCNDCEEECDIDIVPYSKDPVQIQFEVTIGEAESFIVKAPSRSAVEDLFPMASILTIDKDIDFEVDFDTTKFISITEFQDGTMNCVRHQETNRPFLYDSIKEAENDQNFDPETDKVITCSEYLKMTIKSVKVE